MEVSAVDLVGVAEGHRRRKVADLRNPKQPSKVGNLKEDPIG